MFEDFIFEFDSEKNSELLKERGISFEQVVAILESSDDFIVKPHHNKQKYPNQSIIEIDYNEYAYLIPCIIGKNSIFLKTIYPSRKATKNKKRNNKHE